MTPDDEVSRMATARQRKAIERSQQNSPVLRIGERDPQSGLHQVVSPEGNKVTQGEKIYSAQHQPGDVVRATRAGGSGVLQLDAINAGVRESAFDNCPGYFNGQVFNCGEEVKKKVVIQLPPIIARFDLCVYQTDFALCGNIGQGEVRYDPQTGDINFFVIERQEYPTNAGIVVVGTNADLESQLFEIYMDFTCLDYYNLGALGMQFQRILLLNAPEAAIHEARIFRSDNGNPFVQVAIQTGVPTGQEEGEFVFQNIYTPGFQGQTPQTCSNLGTLNVRFRLQFRKVGDANWFPARALEAP
jgi:hypothetical protein